MSLENMSKSANALASLAFVVGLILIMLSKFTSVTGITSTANTAVNNFITGIATYADWAGIIVLIGVGVYLLAHFRKGIGGGQS